MIGLFVAYTMAKYGMSMCVLGMAEEFKDDGIAVNALWPKTGRILHLLTNNLCTSNYNLSVCSFGAWSSGLVSLWTIVFCHLFLIPELVKNKQTNE